jgi:type II secretory pathway pseudopilin PulG
MRLPIISGQLGRKCGFSLLEVVFALGLITVGVTAVLALFPTALKTSHSAQDETRAAHIAQSIFGSLVAQASSQPNAPCPPQCCCFNNVQLVLSDGTRLLPSIDLTTSSSYTLYGDNDGKLTGSAGNATYGITIYTNNSVAGFTDPASANAVTVRVLWPPIAGQGPTPAPNQTFRDYVRIISKY